MQPFASGFLEQLYLVFLHIIIAIAMTMLVSHHALLLRLPAYLVRLFERPPAQPFRFLDLPPEIRNMVYGHLSDQYWITRDRVARRQTGAIFADAFLYLNKQVYREAMHVLVPRMIGGLFRIVVRQNQYLHSTESVLRVKSSFNAKMQKNWHFLLYTRTILLDICFLNYDWLDWSAQGQRESHGVRTLKRNIEMVCVTWLAKMPNLRTIKIGFLGKRSITRDWVPLCPAKDRIPGLLRPLKVIRRKNPRIVIQMPEDCPISTAELAKQQEDTPWSVESKEGLEDMSERLEDLTVLVERMTMDGGFVQ